MSPLSPRCGVAPCRRPQFVRHSFLWISLRCKPGVIRMSRTCAGSTRVCFHNLAKWIHPRKWWNTSRCSVDLDQHTEVVVQVCKLTPCTSERGFVASPDPNEDRVSSCAALFWPPRQFLSPLVARNWLATCMILGAGEAGNYRIPRLNGM